MSHQNIEIERKFLVKDDSWRKSVKSSQKITQGYICTDPEHCVRLRIAGLRAFITIKGKGSCTGASLQRPEFEFEIPVEQAEQMQKIFCGPRVIEKIRYLIEHAGKTWELDEFCGRHAGLFIAEIELNDAGESIAMPPWAGTEITDDHSYANSALAQK